MLGGFYHDLRRALWQAFGHQVFAIAKAAAYSLLLSLFPALLIAAALLAASPEGTSVRSDIHTLLNDVLPPDTLSLVHNYISVSRKHSLRLVLSAGLVTIGAAMGVLLSLMEGFRRAYELPAHHFGFWRERLFALVLIPCTLVPMLFATVFVVFGHQIEVWMVANSDHVLRMYVVLGWRFIRWVIAMATSITVLVMIYHYGVSIRPPWRRVLPGATLATFSWFASTMFYGWYVTRFADYSIVYGPLGAGIATMVWLYIVSLAVLIGAEFNALQFRVAADTLGEVYAVSAMETAGTATQARRV